MIKRSAMALAVSACLGLAGCQNAFDGLSQPEKAPVPKRLINKMKAKNMAITAPIMIRSFKQENVLEVWKQRRNGRYALLDTYEICKWSGKLGPKYKEGDKQAPEGFYFINKYQMNPNSKYHLAFNIGFPNAYDRSHGRTGTHLMVHGACSSAGCYSMTDEQVEIIYALARDAFKGGQKKFQMQAFPFRMTTKNMLKHTNNRNFEFWKMLKKGYDHFEITRRPPKVDVCEKRYEFNTASDSRYPSSGQCPARTMPLSLATSFTKKQGDFLTALEKQAAKNEKRDVVAVNTSFEALLPGVTVKKPAPKVAPTVPAPATTASVQEAALKPAE
ncbi:MAG: murein L,D-transpeptidase family protein [Pseudomonadota bacterium]